MSVFYPTLMFKRITSVTANVLKTNGIKALILDVDNTLTTHDNPIPDKEILLWLEKISQSGIKLIILSNNSRERVKPFADLLGLDFVDDARKPLSKGYKEAAQKLGFAPQNIGVVGDQIFTDILGGNLFGCKTILVEPIEPEPMLFFRVKRKAEVVVLKSYRKKRGRQSK